MLGRDPTSPMTTASPRCSSLPAMVRWRSRASCWTAAPTRRALLSVLDLLERSIADGASLPRAMARALDRYYVARVTPGPEREALTRLMEAHGLDGAQDDRPSREGRPEGAETAASGDELEAEEAAQ